jgi:RNA 2',3'-cyclic 3'-phosphodiesterase
MALLFFLLKEVTMTIRSFIALDLNKEILNIIEESTFKLRKSSNLLIRWVDIQNIHLTLKFLGDVEEKDIAQIESILRETAILFKPFIISIKGFGAFPNKIRPRVIWVGIEGVTDLLKMQETIDERLTELGFQKEERPFSPHLTLGRVMKSATTIDIQKISQQIQQIQVGNLGVVEIDAVNLYKSDLYPTGPVYSRLKSIKLSA